MGSLSFSRLTVNLLLLLNALEKMFYCVYIGNSKVSNTARDVKQASRVQEVRFSLAIYNFCLSADRKQ